MQILGRRATTTAYKARSCLRMLGLEAEVEDARTGVRSLLSDMGVESALWTLPNIWDLDDEQEFSSGVQQQMQLIQSLDGMAWEQAKCFPNSMPLGDLDHMLHLAMSESDIGFASSAGEAWHRYEKQVAAISKFFSKRDVVEAYCQKQIHNNPKIPPASKKTLAQMFRSLCPTMVKTRWHFAFDVLHWISRRRALFLATKSSLSMTLPHRFLGQGKHKPYVLNLSPALTFQSIKSDQIHKMPENNTYLHQLCTHNSGP